MSEAHPLKTPLSERGRRLAQKIVDSLNRYVRERHGRTAEASRDGELIVLMSPNFAATRRAGVWRTDLPILPDHDRVLIEDPALVDKLFTEAELALRS